MSALARLQRAQKKSRRTGAAGALRASAAISVANPNRLVWPEPWQPWQAAATTRREESRGDSQRRCVRFSACLRSTARRALMNTPPATATRESNESSPGTHLNAPPIEGSAPLWFSVKVISFFGDIDGKSAVPNACIEHIKRVRSDDLKYNSSRLRTQNIQCSTQHCQKQ